MGTNISWDTNRAAEAHGLAMNSLDLFRKLGVGAKFDFKRFQGDAQKLKVIRPQDAPERRTIDFFNDNPPTKDRKRKADVEAKAVKKRKGESEESESEDEDEVSDSSQEEEQDSDEESSDEEKEEEEEDVEEEEEELTLLGSMKSNDQRRAKVEKTKLKKKKKMTADKLAAMRQEEINHLRKMSRIQVQGTDILDPMTSFDALLQEGLNPRVLENLKSLGYSEPTPIQMQAIPFMIQRREVLACAPTGSGKTVAFVLPILCRLKEPRKAGFRALILSPTRELATQTYRVFNQVADGTGFRIHYIDKCSTAAKKFGPDSSQKFDILITTPNRLVHMLQQEPPAISLKSIEWFIVDESDKLFEEGKRGFRDQLAAVYQACDGKHVRRAMFSATFAHDVEQWCKLHLDNVVQVYIGARNSATDTVKQELQFVGGESGKLLAIRNIIAKGLTPPVLIFVQSKDRAKELFHELIYEGINVDVIHADRTQLQRDNIVKSFRAGRIWVLICTDLMGRGIDFKGVNLVINYDFPTSTISYIHRIGRTGRAGRAGHAITFFTETDRPNLRSIANVLKTSGCAVPDYLLKLPTLRKDERRKMARSVPHRKSISTVPKQDVVTAAQKKKLLKRLKKGPKTEMTSQGKEKTKHGNDGGITTSENSKSNKSPHASTGASKAASAMRPQGVSHKTNKKTFKDKIATKNGHGKTTAQNKGTQKKKAKQKK